MIVEMKIRETLQVDKIHKCISLIAIVFHVDGQIKKIVSALEIFVDFFDEKFFRKFIRNILYHHSGFILIKN